MGLAQDKKDIKMEKVAVVYHDPCFDGMASLTLALIGILQSRWFNPEKMELIPIPRNYDKAMPELFGFDIIYVVDCGISAALAVDLMAHGKCVTILDHHASHAQEWADWNKAEENEGVLSLIENSPDQVQYEATGNGGCLLVYISNRNRAGCGVVCQHFFPNHKLPWLFQHIEEQDIWRWGMENTKEVISRLSIETYTPEHWETLFKSLENSEAQQAWIAEGKSLALAREQGQKKQLAAVGLTFGSRVFPGDSRAVTYAMINGQTIDAGGFSAMVFGEQPELDMLMVYSINSEGFVSVSLRGQNRVDLSKMTAAWVAAGFVLSGGGHPNAAGAKFKLADFYTLFLAK